ncbi:hypothetical protein ACHW96_004613, partial [Escherichia coli]|nr:hypothetical protein [Salmonella enterica]
DDKFITTDYLQQCRKGYDNAKEYAAFVTKTLVNKDGDIKRRIMSMFSPEERPDDRE